jgi:hypothetical protein
VAGGWTGVWMGCQKKKARPTFLAGNVKNKGSVPTERNHRLILVDLPHLFFILIHSVPPATRFSGGQLAMNALGSVL